MGEIIAFLYNEIIYRPLFNTLIVLYKTIAFGDAGLAIILLTLVIRFLLFPIFHRFSRHQTVMQRIQPEIKKIQEAHSKDLHKQGEAMMELYKKHNVNPFSGIFLLIAQIPVLIALYQLTRGGFAGNGGFENLYSFIQQPSDVGNTLFGLINLEESSTIVVCIAAVAQYFQGRLALNSQKGAPAASPLMRQMVFIGPMITFFVFLRLPSAVGLYWLTSTVFSVAQQYFVNKELRDGRDQYIHKKTN